MLRQAAPVLTSLSMPGAGQLLQRRRLAAGNGYDEDWIQGLVHSHPEILPISAIEAGLHPAAPVCRELSLPSGYLDNLLVTPSGDLIAVECKLWRNVEMRREVFAQAIDYAKDLQRLDYGRLEESIRRARKDQTIRLYDIASSAVPEPLLSEPDFIDAVSRNLRRGRCLILIVGDGISEHLEGMADFLQQHAGLQFTLALVQLAIYDVPDSDPDRIVVVPSVLMRTLNITRGVVQIVDGLPVVSATPPQVADRPATSMTAEALFASLDAREPGSSQRLIHLLNSLADLQVRWDVKKSIMVRMTVGNLEPIPLAISADGKVDTSYLSWFGQKELVGGFAQTLSAAIPGSRIVETPKTLLVKAGSGEMLSVSQLLANPEGVRAAMTALNTALQQQAQVEEMS